jgi:peptidoglycan hydrolase-like protein with peptidoglycan-binding domain
MAPNKGEGLRRQRKIGMKIKTVLFLFLFLGTIALARADQTIESAQQALKDQGFYYGEVTGEKNADTAAAIHRYQIRNGLPVTGELDEATLRSLHNGAAASPQPAAANTPSATPDAADSHDDVVREPTDGSPAPAQPFITPSQAQQSYPRDHNAPSPSGALFARTPYETSAPDAQKNVVASAQRALKQRGIYRHEINGVLGPDLEFSLRAYQARVGLAVTGRLDLETLAALELLPGANTPVYIPRKPSRARAGLEPPVRGEWIHQ